MEIEAMKVISSIEVLNKYLDNNLPTQREIVHWLIDLPFLIEKEKEAGEDLDDFACFYLNIAFPFIKQALKKKYGFKDAINFINYNVFNSNNEDKKLKIEMDNVIKLEDKNLKEVLTFLKKDNRFH